MSIPSCHSGTSSSSASRLNNTNPNTTKPNTPGGLKQPSNNNHQVGLGKSFTMIQPSVTSRLKKNISRTKEKILQGIGKTDRTADESFNLYVENFERQHTQAGKLTKELHRYLTSLKETQRASKNFYESLLDTYEPNWPEHLEFSAQCYMCENKWSDYVDKLVNNVQMPLVSYLNEFPEIKKKIEKRDNRLLDFDNARHNLESVQHKTNKKHGIVNNNNANNMSSSISSTLANSNTNSTEQLTKLTKLKIDLEDKQHVYEDINQTLCMTLPVLFENRVKVCMCI